MAELLKTIKYSCAYYYYKFRFNSVAKSICSEIEKVSETGLPERMEFLEYKEKMIKFGRHMTGLMRMLGHFDDSSNKVPLERRKFESGLLNSAHDKYDAFKKSRKNYNPCKN